MIETIWPQLQLFATSAGEIHPYYPENAHYFRGEEAFFTTTSIEQRWVKPSPELQLNGVFRQLLIDSIHQQAPILSALIHRLTQILLRDLTELPVLVAVLRAGVPIAALLAQLLARHLPQPPPLTALSVFYEIGWDTTALTEIIATYPQRPLWFIDGWTSSGAIAQTLRNAHDRWLKQGYPDFTRGQGIQLIVLADPGGYADVAATHEDLLVPSAGFTAPETLGFSRGFVNGSGLFNVYRFPKNLADLALIEHWLNITNIAPIHFPERTMPQKVNPPQGWKLHFNEVVRTLINRMPKEIWLAESAELAQENYALLLYLAELRNVPIYYERREVIQWEARAAARLI